MDIKYVAHFDHPSNEKEGRGYALSAATKIEYIADALERVGHDVLIVSPSQTRKRTYYSGKTIALSPRIRLKLFPTFPRGNVAKRAFRYLSSRALLLTYLLLHTHRDEPVLVYHSLSIQGIVLVAKAIRNFRLILEVEEIYQDVVPSSYLDSWTEYALFRRADAFIFSTELLNDKLNPNDKPHAIVYGTYKTVVHAEESAHDGVTHVVYAGTLDPRKGGAAAAAAAAAHLGEAFRVHILGFGSDNDIEALREVISEVDGTGTARVSYDGLLKGSEFSRFLAQCDIGLSTQDPEAKFNDTSFPSKILSYLAHGLRVVSVRIPAVERSQIATAVTFYESQDPRLIADAIRNASSSKVDVPALMKRLDTAFVSDLANVISSTLKSKDCQ